MRNEWSFVYVMTTPPGFKKVGIATDPQARLLSVQLCNPTEVKLAFTRCVPAESALWIEARAHETLRPYHARGEWFKCSVQQAAVAIIGAINQGVEHANTRRESHNRALAVRAREKRTGELDVDDAIPRGQATESMA